MKSKAWQILLLLVFILLCSLTVNGHAIAQTTENMWPYSATSNQALGYPYTVYGITSSPPSLTGPRIPQENVQQRQTLGIELRAQYQRTSLLFGESWNGANARMIPMIDLLASSGPTRMKVLWIPRQSWQADQFTPNSSFAVNGTEFFKADVKDRKPVDMQWTVSDIWGIDVSASRGELRPTAAVRWFTISVDANQKLDDKVVTASQSWLGPLWMAGATYVYSYPGMSLELCGMAGQKIAHIGCVLACKLTDFGLIATGGCNWEEWRLGELKVRNLVPFLGVVKEW